MCYATPNMKLVKRNQKLHNSDSILLVGEVKEGDVVKEVREPSYIETHEKVVLLRHNFNQFHFAIFVS